MLTLIRGTCMSHSFVLSSKHAVPVPMLPGSIARQVQQKSPSPDSPLLWVSLLGDMRG